jgi:hypothetical protein
MFAAAIALLGSRELIVQAADAVLDGDTRHKRRPIDIQGLHGSSAVVIHRIRGQVEDARQEHLMSSGLRIRSASGRCGPIGLRPVCWLEAHMTINPSLPSRHRCLLCALAQLLLREFSGPCLAALQATLAAEGDGRRVFLLGRLLLGCLSLWLPHALRVRAVAVGGILLIYGLRWLRRRLLGWRGRSLAGSLIHNRACDLVEVADRLLLA